MNGSSSILSRIKQRHNELKHRIHNTKFIVSSDKLKYIKLFYLTAPIVIGCYIMNIAINYESNNRQQWIEQYNNNNKHDRVVVVAVAPPPTIYNHKQAIKVLTDNNSNNTDNNNQTIQLREHPLDWTHRRQHTQAHTQPQPQTTQPIDQR